MPKKMRQIPKPVKQKYLRQALLYEHTRALHRHPSTFHLRNPVSSLYHELQVPNAECENKRAVMIQMEIMGGKIGLGH